MYRKLTMVANRYLDISIDYIGSIPKDKLHDRGDPQTAGSGATLSGVEDERRPLKPWHGPLSRSLRPWNQKGPFNFSGNGCWNSEANDIRSGFTPPFFRLLNAVYAPADTAAR